MLSAAGLVAGQGYFRTAPLSFAFPPGTLLALLGPNGCGKTTLLRTLAGLLPPLQGAIDVPPPVALLPAPGTPAPSHSVRYTVMLGRSASRGWSTRFGPADRASAEVALERVGLTDLANHPFDRISSGQQQRVLLARALAQDARLLLLDEPTALLDPAHAQAVAALLAELRAEGRTLVVGTHDLALAAAADQVLLLGSTPVLGLPAELLTSPALAKLYNAPLTLCHICGQPTSATDSAAGA